MLLLEMKFKVVFQCKNAYCQGEIRKIEANNFMNGVQKIDV